MKRILSAILTVAIFLPAALLCLSGVDFCCRNAFADADLVRKEALSRACMPVGEDVSLRFSVAESKKTDRYIVRFSDALSEEALLSLLEGTAYRLLADSRERVFAVNLSDEAGFRASCGDALLYCCADHTLSTAALPDDPLLEEVPAYSQMELYAAWEAVTPSRDITVAVLDTGVDRLQEDMEGVALLSGYDAVDRTVGVADDPDGHGTEVTGLIAAAAGNGKGIAGVAYGVQILPVRVSDGANVIYSSDLILGIRFAADAGAQILNLSLGGYTYSAAEYDAVQYAIEKGCILIAAAGNDGTTAQGSKEIFPASYDGVISVGSCAPDGTRSAFSQRNNRVDLLAPGEGLWLLGQYGDYRKSFGTSYSAALVSGIAALAMSALDSPVRFTGDELLTLLADGRTRLPNGYGYGSVSARQAVQDANCPLITGVESDRIYSNRVTIGFNRGMAYLDGETFRDGGTVFKNGRHVLIVKDGEWERTVVFRLRYTPAEYTLSEEGGVVSVTYTGGTATVDGFPYASGTPISSPGRHLFRLTDTVGGVTERTFYCDPELPQVTGVLADGVYDHPVWIRFAGSGEILLDGTRVEREVFVTEDGVHTLQLSNGDRARTLTFTLRTEMQQWNTKIEQCELLADPAHGWYALYGKMLTGIRVYSTENGEYRFFISTGGVRGYAYAEDKLLLFCEQALCVLDPAAMQSTDALVASYPVKSDAFAYLNGQVYCLSDGALYTVSTENGEMIRLFASDAEELYTDGTALWLYAGSKNRYTRYDGLERVNIQPLQDGNGLPKKMTADWLFCGGQALRLPDLQTVFSYDGYAVGSTSELLYTSEGVYRLSDGMLVGRFDLPLSGMSLTEKGLYLCFRLGEVRYFRNGIGYASVAGDTLTSPAETDPYTSLYRIYGKQSTVCVATEGNRLAVVFGEARKLFQFQNGRLEKETELSFSPTGVALTETQCVVWSEHSGTVWTDGVLSETGLAIRDLFYCADGWYLLGSGLLYRLEEGQLVRTSLPAVRAAGAGNTLCRLNGGRLYIRNGEETTSVRCDATSLLTDGTYVVAGTRVYRADTGTLKMQLPDRALAICDGTVLTESGLYDIEREQKLTGIDASDCRAAALASGYGAVLCAENTLTVSGYSRPIWAEPTVSGIGNGEMLSERAMPRFDRGIGYLDGEPFTSGDTVEIPGDHVLSVVLPCSIVWEYAFTVIPALNGISFATPVYRLAAGESGTLRVQYSPTGAQRVPVNFSCEGDCIQLESDGRFVALRDGTATVTASTTDGRFTATCRVTVTATLLRFAPDCAYRIDRASELLLDVPAGLRAEELLEQVISDGEVTASASTVGTGTVLTLLSAQGEELDRLTVVVTGDLDGDGYVTVNDLVCLELALEENNADELRTLAGDLVGNGGLSDQDVEAMQRLLLFADGNNRRPIPPRGKSGELGLFFPHAVCCGDELRVTVCLQDGEQADCVGCCGASGRLTYDPEQLTYLGRETYGWEVQVYDSGQWVSFLAAGKAEGILPLVTLRFAVREGAKDAECGLLLRDGTVACDGNAFGTTRQEETLLPTARVYGALDLRIVGMTSEFSEEKTVYDVQLPAGTPGLDYQAVYPEGCTLTAYHTLFNGEDALEATFVFRFADGSSKSYTVRARRDGKRLPGTDSTLASLTVAGLPFVFDPTVTEYVLTVPYDTERLQLQWVLSDPRAKAVCDSPVLTVGERTALTVTVTAEDGSETVYTLWVFRSEKTSQGGTQTPVPVRKNRWLWLIPTGILLFGSAAIFAMNRHDRKKKMLTQPDAGEAPASAEERNIQDDETNGMA